MTHFIIGYHISLVKVQANYCNDNLLILDVKQLNKIMKLYYFHTFKALWDDQGKIKMYYGMSRVKKQLSGKIPFTPKTLLQSTAFFYLSLKEDSAAHQIALETHVEILKMYHQNDLKVCR